MSAVEPTAVVDVLAVAVVVVVALIFLGSRFVEKRGAGASSGVVVVGAGLQKGLDRARKARRAR